MEPIPITRPWFDEAEEEAVLEPLRSGWVVQGPRVEAFERRFADFTGSPHAAAATSCTTALHMCVDALGLEPGDEVVVPGFTWVATANVVEYMGARPVFVDVELDTFNVDPGALEAAVTPRTVGLIPVHLFGVCCDMEPVLGVAERNDLWVLEDAACALGARIGEDHAGTMGDAGCFSLHPRKSITTGEGGMVTTGDAHLDRMVRSLRDHGAIRTDLERHEGEEGYRLAGYPRRGYNFRMTDLQGAVGEAQMDKLDRVLERRRMLAARYDAALSELDWFVPQRVPEEHVHGYQAYVGLFRPEEPTLDNVDRLHGLRNELMGGLEREGIATRQGTHAAGLVEYYRERYDLSPRDLQRSWICDRLTITLPLFPQMSGPDVDRVVEALIKHGPS